MDKSHFTCFCWYIILSYHKMNNSTSLLTNSFKRFKCGNNLAKMGKRKVWRNIFFQLSWIWICAEFDFAWLICECSSIIISIRKSNDLSSYWLFLLGKQKQIEIERENMCLFLRWSFEHAKISFRYECEMKWKWNK